MGIKIITNNKKAYHDYFIEETYECGIELKGTEVKSLRQGNASINEAICKIIHNECYILSMNINPYERGNIFNVDSMRTRKLLLHKREINKILEKIKLKGYTLIPIKVYFKDSKVKVEIAIAKGKKLYDKREDIKKKDMNKEMNKNYKNIVKNFVFILLFIMGINIKSYAGASVYVPPKEIQDILKNAVTIENTLPSNGNNDVSNEERRNALFQIELDNPLNAGFWQIDDKTKKFRYFRFNKYSNNYEMLAGRVYSIYDDNNRLFNYYFDDFGNLISNNTVFGEYLFVIDSNTGVITGVLPLSFID